MITDLSVLTSLFILFSCIYFILLATIFFALRTLDFNTCTDESAKISIVIAARNEAGRIQPCLVSLSKLTYPSHRFEIIFVDDSSDDDTADIIENYCTGFPNWKLIRIKEKSDELKGKKNALHQGILKAQGDLIFTTDADCTVDPEWLSRMSASFQPQVAMVIGFSPFSEGRELWRRFLEFDTLFSAIVAAASVRLGVAYTSTGRNLVYRKKAYLESGGFEVLKKYRSGDDMHLTRLFRKKNIGKIRYSVHPSTFVHTQPPQSFALFFHQQIRKNSKMLYSGIIEVILGALLLLYHILFYFNPLIIAIETNIWAVFVFIKIATEYLVLRYASVIFRQGWLKKWLLPAQLVYPPFIIFFSILGAFQKYRWKS